MVISPSLPAMRSMVRTPQGVAANGASNAQNACHGATTRLRLLPTKRRPPWAMVRSGSVGVAHCSTMLLHCSLVRVWLKAVCPRAKAGMPGSGEVLNRVLFHDMNSWLESSASCVHEAATYHFPLMSSLIMALWLRGRGPNSAMYFFVPTDVVAMR